MKTALITGVSGYLGSHVAKELKKAGFEFVTTKRLDNYNLMGVGKKEKQNEI
jgi:nucleoside-diphosphate-sugar epimerase